ncbi:hypothetical protein [Paracoccus marcusii]|uniref:hypothetical protein n=1 Tax=Paracoccus marcusii TaxID=59779 RepID=UPI0039C86E36
MNPQQRRYAKVMAQSGALLLGHVNSVLDIARADAGRCGWSRSPSTRTGWCWIFWRRCRRGRGNAGTRCRRI